MAPKRLLVKDLSTFYDTGSIINMKTGTAVSFEELMADLSGARVIYVGEQHRDPVHHHVQLEVIKALLKSDPNIAVGMEMFDQTYQKILNLWSNGELDQATFLEKVHWYANWKFDFGLYQEILDFVKKEKIRLIGLNIPFHIPPKIAVGGIETLADDEKKLLPKKIDTSNAAHRDYIEQVFKQHHVRGIDKFDFFYTAQCVWEDSMAEAVALNLKEDRMVVLAGNGHIVRKFGMPDRAFRWNKAVFKTIYLAPAGSEVESNYADYTWVTPLRKP
ncbi:MAG: ChaN family lipoprotein [Proteobacteria bacterium]|nr:ChaN family lipoprotein [Pseudomonadota bacterium]